MEDRLLRRRPLENRLLKSLTQPSSPISLENKLLARLNLKSSLLSRRSGALPLRSSVLAKYEAKHQLKQQVCEVPNVFLQMGPTMECAEDQLMCYDDDEEMDRCISAAPPSPQCYRENADRRARKRLRGPMVAAAAFGMSDESWAMPDVGYDFTRVDLAREFDDCDAWPAQEESSRRGLQLTRAAKLRFLNTVCVSLVSQTNFRDKEDAVRCDLVQQAAALAKQQPEFVLKVALYARQELQLRTTTNFLLSLAAWLEPCRPFLRKYFCAAIRLPTDWIEVAELYQIFDDGALVAGALPCALRKVMVEKFSDFDEYQLAKYNRAKKKGKPSPAAGDAADDDDMETEQQRQRRCFTIKQLIRLLHVRQPAEHVMAIVGKKYPTDPDQFRRSGLSGTFDSRRSGRRMRLPVPETWETQVASRGNKAEVWRDLIDHKKLPYMAMLRNLRNMIMAGIGAVHHDKVIKTLTNEGAVRNSRQMAFRYLSAYEALDELKRMKEKDMKEKAEGTSDAGIRAARNAKERQDPWYKRRQRQLKARKTQIKYDLHVIEQYRSALDRAVAIAAVHNVSPIAGTSLVFCDISDSMDVICASAKGFGKPKTARTMAVLLALMCMRSCENSELFCLRGPLKPKRVQWTEDCRHLLQKAADVEAMASATNDDHDDDDADNSDCSDSSSISSDSGIVERQDHSLEGSLDLCLRHRCHVDTIVVLGQGGMSARVRRTLDVYRRTVNPNLLFVNIDLIHPATSANTTGKSEEDNLNVTLHGFSDQILRFVAERGTSSQLAAVDAIDVKYRLRRDIRLPPVDLRETILASEAVTKVTRWRTVRVFISSTFLDMHGERDLLIRHVLPELRSRARALRIDLQVVDLRWGITAQQAEDRGQLELCLAEIDRCQLFVGLLGARYGRPLEDYTAQEQELVDYLTKQQPGFSLTALEMLYATRTPELAAAAVFYQRDDEILSSVPGEVMEQFADLAAGRRRLAELRAELKSRGCHVQTYTASYGGVVGGRPVATSLQPFGEDVMEKLWNTMQTLYPLQAAACDLVTEEYTLQDAFATSQNLIGRAGRLTRTKEEVQRGQGRLLLVTGKPGSGKTVFLARLYAELDADGDREQRLLVPAFCGAGQQCHTPAGLLSYLLALLARRPLQPAAAAQLPQLTAQLAELLTVRGRRQHVVLVLDGLETLREASGAAAAADWLPSPLPQNVTVVVSADEGSALCRRLNSMPRVVSVSLGPLELSERSTLVRYLLQHHSKTLDESAWNNQLRSLTSKRGAGDPLYLRLACEELRTFGVFEQVSGKLAALGQTIPALTQDIVQRLEETYGAQLVRPALSALALSENGLTEDDLLGFLKSVHCRIGATVSKPLTQFGFTTLLRSAESLLRRWSAPGQPAMLLLAHAEMARVVRSRYLAGSQGEAHVKQLATSLAEYFAGCCETASPAPPSALLALPHFWAVAQDLDEYRNVVCSLRYLAQALESGLTSELMSLVTAPGVADSAARRQYLQHPHVTQTQHFLQRNLHLLTRSPGLLVQQALNEPEDSWLREAAEGLPPPSGALLRLSGQPQRSVSQPPHCAATLHLHQPVTAAAVDPDTETVYVGLNSGEIKALELSTGREVHNLTGHGEPITGLALLSGGRFLVSGCAAGQLGVWCLLTGQRLVTKEAHRRRLTGLAARPDTNEFVTVAWSCDLKLWLFRPGSGLGGGSGAGAELQQLRQLAHERRPLSCVAHHPTRPLVATGGWDGKLKIWDTTEMQRKAVRHGHEYSVRCVAISPDASYIVSGDMEGQLIVWGTTHGDKIQKWQVHQGAVHAVCYLSSQRYVTAGADGDVKLWRAHVGVEVGRRPCDAAVLQAVPFSARGTGASRAAAMLMVTADGWVSARPASGENSLLWSVRLPNVTAAACDGRRAYLAVGRAVVVLSLIGGKRQRELAVNAPVTALTCLPDGADDADKGVVYIGLEDGRVGVGLADRGDLVSSLGHSGQVTSLAVTLREPHSMMEGQPGPPVLASGGRDGMVLVWGPDNEYTAPLKAIHAYATPVSSVGWFGSRLVTAGHSSELHIYQSLGWWLRLYADMAEFDREPSQPTALTGNSSPVCALSVLEPVSGRWDQATHLLSTATDGQVLLWTESKVAVTRHTCRSGSSASLTRVDGALVALLPQEDGVQIMDLQQMKCAGSFVEHTANVSSVATTKLGLLSASLDGSAKVWSAEEGAAASACEAVLAMRLLGASPDGSGSDFVTVSRDSRVRVWRWSHNLQSPTAPELIHTVHIKRTDSRPAREEDDVLEAALGPVDRDDSGATSFSAVVRTGGGGCRARVTLTPGGAGSHDLSWWRHRAGAAPPLCLAADGHGGAPLLGDADGRVTVMDAELQPHATWQCGSGADPALALIQTVEKTVITCDRSGLLCRVQQTDRLNAVNVLWEPLVPAARRMAAPLASQCQLPATVNRWDGDGDVTMEEGDAETPAAAFPTALLASETDALMGDANGRIWWRSGDVHRSQQAHVGAVRWLGRDPARRDVLYSSGADRLLQVWRVAADGARLQQVGEFEFPSRVEHCLLVAAPGGSRQSTALLCGDDRGRLHCLRADLTRVTSDGDEDLDN